jgi:hypothetical protein
MATTKAAPAAPEPRVVVTGTNVELADGTVVAQIQAVTVGGGTQTVTVDGVPEERQHPTLHLFHVRLLSPDRMIPDELREAESYEDAVEVGLAYAARRVQHAQQVADLATALKAG